MGYLAEWHDLLRDRAHGGFGSAMRHHHASAGAVLKRFVQIEPALTKEIL